MNGAAPTRLAVVSDYLAEGWPSMDLVADMLVDRLVAEHAEAVDVTLVRPGFRHRATRLPVLGSGWLSRSADRLLNRWVDYPRTLRRIRADFDLFHIADHSYAHLVHALPAHRTGVMCHDLDLFRPLLEPGAPRWRRAMARLVLAGLERAAVVFCISRATHAGLLTHGLVDPDRLVVTPLGASTEFRPEGPSPRGITWPTDGAAFLLHVGSCIPRKRIDVLLEVFARSTRRHPALRLVKVGGAFTPAQQALVARSGVADRIVHLTDLARLDLADLYRRAALVLQPSEAEGFGLPVVEAMACGAPVIASDLPVLQEVGGAAAVYCPVGDVDAWTIAVERALDQPASLPSRQARLDQAARFSWSAHTQLVLASYERLTRHRAVAS